MMRRRTLILSAGAALAAGTLPGAAAAGLQVIGGAAFGSTWRAVLPAGVPLARVKAAIEQVVRSVDGAMSPFRADSEIALLNAASLAGPGRLSAATGVVVAEALRVADQTDGAYDPTVGPLVNRFGFGPIHGALGGGYQDVELSRGKLLKDRPGLTLDLCGIAKGHALDRMAQALDDLGVRTCLLEAGGDLLARGQHPKGRDWRVAIEAAGDGRAGAERIVGLNGMAVATSGDAVNGGRVGGVRFNHIIDPRTRRPADNGVLSVTVIDRSAMRADALATGLFVLGPDLGIARAEALDLAVLYQMQGRAGVYELKSPQFDHYIVA